MTVGLLVLAAVVAVGFGLATGVLQRWLNARNAVVMMTAAAALGAIGAAIAVAFGFLTRTGPAVAGVGNVANNRSSKGGLEDA